jgi:hypothetical protein
MDERKREKERKSDRRALRRELFNEGIFSRLAQLLVFPDPEIKVKRFCPQNHYWLDYMIWGKYRKSAM